MKRLFILLITLLFTKSTIAQQGYFRTRENSGTNTTDYYRYWPGPITANLPVYWRFSDSGKIWLINHDTIILSRFVGKNNNPGATTILSIDNSNGYITGTNKGSLLTDVVKYIDTTSMLSPYISAMDTVNRWAPYLPYLLSENDPVWVAASSNYWTKIQADIRYLLSNDTSSMLNPYLRKLDTTNKWAPKLPYLLSFTETDPKFVTDSSLFLGKILASLLYQPKGSYQPAGNYVLISDTSNMLSKYLRKIDTTSKWAFKANYLLTETDPVSVHISDTALMLTPYVRKNDTSSMLIPYLKKIDTTGKWQFKANYLLVEVDPLSVKIADSSLMLSKYLRKQDTTAMLNGYYRSINPNAYISRTGISGGTGISYNNTTGVISTAATSPSFNNAPGRAISATGYQISATRTTSVSYTVSVTTTLSLLNLNSSGQVFLEISPDNSVWTTVNSAGVTRALSVAITIGLNDINYYNLQCMVPIGYYTRLRGVTSGGATLAFTSGQEVQL